MPAQSQLFLRPLHVIHIDDSNTVQVQVASILSSSRYPKFVLHGFKSFPAVEQWLGDSNRDQFDCILLDLSLDEIEGLDTFIYAMSIFKTIPIIVLSGTCDTDLAGRLIHYGAEISIGKGISEFASLPFYIAQIVARKSKPQLSPLADAMATFRAMQNRAKILLPGPDEKVEP